MKKTNIRQWGLALAALCVTSSQQLYAQNTLPDSEVPMIVTPHKQILSSDERTININVESNVDWTYTTDADWFTLKRSSNGVYAMVQANYMGLDRSAEIVFKNEEKGVSSTLKIEQGRFTPSANNANETLYRPISATSTSSFSGNPFSRTYDGDYSTFWHSDYSNYTPRPSVSEETPITLVYNFSNVESINQIRYVPRQDGQSNGHIEKVTVNVKCKGETDYTLLGTYEWSSSSSVKRIRIPEGLSNPIAIQFVITKGTGNFASCAEMEFASVKEEEGDGDFSVFADDMYSSLKPGFTEADFANLENPIAKSLAYQMMHGSYPTAYRVASYECHNSPQYYSRIWSAPGKLYDQLAGVTGINMKKGTHAILVRDIPEGMNVELRVVAWYSREVTQNDKGDWVGGGPVQQTFALENGMNFINYTNDFDGLAYIAYYDENGKSAERPAIRVHFINGDAQGYLSPDKTNDEMHKLTANASNACMDVVGSKVHTVWTANGLHSYCKAIDGSIGYRQYMNIIDSLIEWEHNLLGFTKYNHVPDLRTMAYVNYTYYMFQGGYGVSFKYDTESRVLNCNQLVNNDEDAIWGLSHEWGHQHQMKPYFCWAGMSEITNNMNSYYNIMKMGYRDDREKGNFPKGIQVAIDDKVIAPWDGYCNYTLKTVNGEKVRVSNHRKRAYDERNLLDFNPNLKAVATAMKDSVITTYAEDPDRAIALQELSGADPSLTPYIKLYCYFRDNGYPDVAADWYEALRQGDNEEGSTLEKQNGLDKYELLSKAQNSSNEAWTKFKSTYPTSVWTTKNLVNPDRGWYANSVPAIMNWIRKVSRLTGYNLFPYFERWGFVRPIAMYIGDYGNMWYIMSKEMLEEFKADMKALETTEGLKVCDEALIRAIVDNPEKTFSRPSFPN